MNPSMQLGTFPVYYQTTEDEVHSIAIGNVPQPLVAGFSERVVQETENLASLSYDGYRVE